MREHPLSICEIIDKPTNRRTTSAQQNASASCCLQGLGRLPNTRKKLKTWAFKVIKDLLRYALRFSRLKRESHSITKIIPCCQAFFVILRLVLTIFYTPQFI
jgi:hypothetical protein